VRHKICVSFKYPFIHVVQFDFSDPRKIHSEEDSDCETLAESQSYLSGDFDYRYSSDSATAFIVVGNVKNLTRI
jgi:hypothetical protein